MTTCLSSVRSRTSLEEQEIETETLSRLLQGFSLSLIEKNKGVVLPRIKLELREMTGLGLLNERGRQNAMVKASTTHIPNLEQPAPNNAVYGYKALQDPGYSSGARVVVFTSRRLLLVMGSILMD